MAIEELQLVEPIATLQAEYEAYCREFEYPNDIPGNCSMAQGSDFPDGVRRCLAHGRGRELPNGWVAAHTFWLLRNGRELLGMINVRHGLTPFLQREGGHIGYSVRASERGNGYGTRMLKMTLERIRGLRLGLRRVLITCDERNVASARVIEKCGGVLENDVRSSLPGRKVTRRFWIDL